MLDINAIRNDFDMFKNNPGIIYFDNGATTLKPKCVNNAIDDFYKKYTSNIHRGDYDVSVKVSKSYDDVRNIVKEFINADSNLEIVFTSGATESLNTVAFGYGLSHLKEGDVILTTYLEHASNILPWFDVAKKTKAIIKYVPLNSDGTFNLDEYTKCFNDLNVKIVSLPFVSNVLGYINPLKDIIKIAHNHKAVVNVDGAQAVPHIRVDVKELDIDFLSFSAHKMCGPSGVGVLYGKYKLLEELNPLKYGGGANSRFDKDGNVILSAIPTRFEAGTPNIEGVLGLGEAINYLTSIGIDNIHYREVELINYLKEKLSKLNNVVIYNIKSDCAILSFNVKDVFAQDAASFLNSKGICVRSGNHCAKILHNVIGVNETIRASLYFYNTKEEIDKFVEALMETTLENCIGAVI